MVWVTFGLHWLLIYYFNFAKLRRYDHGLYPRALIHRGLAVKDRLEPLGGYRLTKKPYLEPWRCVVITALKNKSSLRLHRFSFSTISAGKTWKFQPSNKIYYRKFDQILANSFSLIRFRSTHKFFFISY